MTDEDGDGVAEQPTSQSHPQGGARHGVCGVCSASVPPAGERRGKAVFTAWGLGTLTGAIDETLQIFSHRGSQVRDVLIDTAGALLGLGVVMLILYLISRKEKSN